MADLTPEQMRRMHDFAEQLAELAEDRWKVQVPYAFGDTVTAGRWTLDTSSLKSYPADW
ncbi:hypothetical protein ACGFX2_35815 [Streptomyces goshikiensis]|uniref:hypothetical protein n=1 Tax=Streptomyces goshikiensis TaxID=1942 RepID=UPI003717812C